MGALRKILVGCCCMAALPAPSYAADLMPAPGEGAWYIRGDAGIGITDFSIFDGETAFAMGAGIGYKYNEMLRTDITFDAAFDYNTSVVLGVVGAAPLVADVSLDAYDIMLNGYVDFAISSLLKPYIGAGIGYGWLEASAAGITDDEDGLALAGMAGLAFDISDQITLDVGYKYRLITIPGEDFDDHLIRGGLRFYLN